MKFTTLLTTTLAACATALAAPLKTSYLAANTAWLAHLDLDNLQQTVSGRELVTTIKDAIAKNKNSGLSLDVDAVLAELHSFTAYGTTFDQNSANNSVLILEVGPKARAILDGIIAAQELNGTASKIKVESADTYLVDGQLHLKFATPTLVLASKSSAQIETSHRVILGQSPAYSPKNSKLLLSPTDGFFLIAAANGFNQIADLPPQARVLQKATGAQLALGEDNQNIHAELALATTGAEVSDQLARIIEGMAALITFAETGDQNLAKLAQAIVVKKAGGRVNVTFTYPAKELEKIFTAVSQNSGKSPGNNNASITEIEITDSLGGTPLSISNIDASTSMESLPRYAIDNDPSTIWRSRGRNQWLRCELATPALVQEIQIAWFNGEKRRASFIIETSSDGMKWNPILRRKSSGTTQALESINIPDTTTRWIRINCQGNSTDQMNAIAELRILGLPTPTESLPQPEAAK